MVPHQVPTHLNIGVKNEQVLQKRHLCQLNAVIKIW